MKNPLHLFRSGNEAELPPHLAPFPPLQRRGPSTKMVTASVAMLLASFAGLAAGLKWLQSDEPKDNRPWEPHEALMATAPGNTSDKEALEVPNPDALAPLNSPSPPDLLSPPAPPSPPVLDQPAPAIAERVDNKPAKPPQSAKTSATVKASKSAPVKARPAKIASTKATSSAKKRTTTAQAAKPLKNATPNEVRTNGGSEFAQSDIDDIPEQRFPDDEARYDSNRVERPDYGRVMRRFYDEDQPNYYTRPPRREFVRAEHPPVVEVRRPGVVIRYRINYGVSSSPNRILVRRVAPVYRVIAIRDRDEEW